MDPAVQRQPPVRGRHRRRLAANTTIPLLGGITVILNEQVPGPGVLLVNAVHIKSALMDIVLASARSDIHNCL